ncbi:Protein of unknown function [Pyronema omphalodes CBS 100304]|uniref:Uncharacterized protein n=1 Tax=Pyronema omphalodes (strain CBS 100304) TaxID=1076935 RepID=U4LU56_PYROM|nr:Protein of unknown function [Pyronema omphalodes CBS 100304]
MERLFPDTHRTELVASFLLHCDKRSTANSFVEYHRIFQAMAKREKSLEIMVEMEALV